MFVIFRLVYKLCTQKGNKEINNDVRGELLNKIVEQQVKVMERSLVQN